MEHSKIKFALIYLYRRLEKLIMIQNFYPTYLYKFNMFVCYSMTCDNIIGAASHILFLLYHHIWYLKLFLPSFDVLRYCLPFAAMAISDFDVSMCATMLFCHRDDWDPAPIVAMAVYSVTNQPKFATSKLFATTKCGAAKNFVSDLRESLMELGTNWELFDTFSLASSKISTYVFILDNTSFSPVCNHPNRIKVSEEIFNDTIQLQEWLKGMATISHSMLFSIWVWTSSAQSGINISV